MAGNQTQTMRCNLMQLPHKAAMNNTARCSLKFTVTSEANVAVNPSRKRRSEMSIDDDQRWKKQKMDCKVTAECSQLLKGLMDRRIAQGFARPVDPMKTPPDYFNMIKNPMDLGTIKRKLERNMYSAPNQFADDMVLTFGNAMLYHPPSSDVYRCARLLDCNFRRMWEILAAKLKLVVENSHQVMKPTIGLTKAPIAEKRGNSRRVSVEKKLKLGRLIKNIKPEKTTLNGCTSLSKTADKGVNRCQEPAIDARTRGIVPNEEKSPCSTPAEGDQMSPKNALRAAMLKRRFTDTIFKAHQKLNEKTRIEEQFEAAKMASRERERNAARMALEKIKKTVEIDSPPNLLREMDILFGCYSNPKSLERIGFYLKQNYVEEDEVYEKED